MPFETIEVDMYLKDLYDNGMKLFFEYYSMEGRERRKLAYGHNILLWAKRADENSIPIADLLPGVITDSVSLRMSS
ncbi:MAG: hypothetical protein HC906_05240 [Bacteroidales bacterium]|nr:hypothetical protein [Bacteroidales bacterium]